MPNFIVLSTIVEWERMGMGLLDLCKLYQTRYKHNLQTIVVLVAYETKNAYNKVVPIIRCYLNPYSTALAVNNQIYTKLLLFLFCFVCRHNPNK